MYITVLLGKKHSTAELHPQAGDIIKYEASQCQEFMLCLIRGGQRQQFFGDLRVLGNEEQFIFD